MAFQVLNPTHEEPTGSEAMASRLADLRGARIALLSNGKAAVAPFFDHVERILRREVGVAEVLRIEKSNYSAPAEGEIITELTGWDAVLSGVGD